jgi:hypothetical protein
MTKDLAPSRSPAAETASGTTEVVECYPVGATLAGGAEVTTLRGWMPNREEFMVKVVIRSKRPARRSTRPPEGAL